MHARAALQHTSSTKLMSFVIIIGVAGGPAGPAFSGPIFYLIIL